MSAKVELIAKEHFFAASRRLGQSVKSRARRRRIGGGERMPQWSPVSANHSVADMA